ncbi:MAG: endolytic transglycosylase MltG [Candidatus Aegiribacteria sp.]|nr:endolytic transglycosylase MltG [Candidatus Aegiribacteria sp.]
MKRAAALVILGLIILLLTGLILMKWCGRPSGNGKDCVFTVERGWGVRQIAETLADSGLIRCPVYFLWRYSQVHNSPSLQAGVYHITDSMSPDSILRILSTGDVIPVETSWVTLAPALTLEQSLDILNDSLGFSRTSLDSLSRDSSFLSSLDLPTLEGYLFPETYEFADSLQAEQVLRRIVETGISRWPADRIELLESSGLSVHETIILASIVEREAKVDSEREVISGVFLSRMRCGMKLESCATVQYAIGEVREVLLYSDLEIDSPYNTYRVTGLPPGPICSPGESSISAAFSPDIASGNLYFVSMEDGSGRHLFAKTHSGHLANIRSLPDR